MTEVDIDSPISVVRGIIKPDEKEATEFAQDLKAGRRKVFFYAISQFDWQPLHRFTHLCDTFVYVDPRAKDEGADCFDVALHELVAGATLARGALVTDQTPNLIPPEGKYTIVAYDLGELVEMREEPWSDVLQLSTHQGWGKVWKLIRRVGSVDRIIWLVYIKGSPLTVYRRLFIEKGTSPEFLAIGPAPHHQDAPQGFNREVAAGWLATFGWDGGFGQLVRDGNSRLPQLIAADEALAWPTNPYRYRINAWSRNPYGLVFTTNQYGWKTPKTASEPAPRHITITRKNLTPQSARATGAVVLTFATHGRFSNARWPKNTMIILDGIVVPEPDEPPFIAPPNEEFVDLNHQPLLQSLSEIEQICAVRGITSVAIDRLPGFEDEADDLVWWRKQDGPIKRLIIHVECPGHYIDFAKAADIID